MNRKGSSSIWLVLLVVIVAAAGFVWWQGDSVPGEIEGETSSSSSVSSSARPQVAAKEVACGDRQDDDRDGLIDCDDPNCAGSPLCGCAARSCGDPNRPDVSEFSCLPAEGCYCESGGGCQQCRTRGDTCMDSTECCGGGMNLVCDTVTLASGALEKRCVTPSE